jgi:hypothetical protein
VLRDAVVNRSEAKELLAVTHAAAVTGEELTLDLMSEGQTVAVKVRVLESRPVMVDGAVRHRVRLALPAPTAEQGVIDGQAPDASRLEPVASDALENPTLRVAEAG